jgi:hypothetical protein
MIPAMAEVGTKAATGQPVMGVDADGNLQFLSAVGQSAIGTPADTAWDGITANPTIFALLKAIAVNTAGP